MSFSPDDVPSPSGGAEGNPFADLPPGMVRDPYSGQTVAAAKPDLGWTNSPKHLYTSPSYLQPQSQPPKQKQYHVPRRLSLSSIIGIMTAMAMLFGCLRYMNAPPVVYLFLAVETAIICVLQMAYESAPRQVSAIAGAVLGTLLGGGAMAMESSNPGAMLCALPFIAAFSALLGYVVGACAAGVFLVTDMLEAKLSGKPYDVYVDESPQQVTVKTPSKLSTENSSTSTDPISAVLLPDSTAVPPPPHS